LNCNPPDLCLLSCRDYRRELSDWSFTKTPLSDKAPLNPSETSSLSNFTCKELFPSEHTVTGANQRAGLGRLFGDTVGPTPEGLQLKSSPGGVRTWALTLLPPVVLEPAWGGVLFLISHLVTMALLLKYSPKKLQPPQVLSLSQNTWGNQLKRKKGLFWFIVSELSVHDCLAL
jgi:hypothetical protein